MSFDDEIGCEIAGKLGETDGGAFCGAKLKLPTPVDMTPYEGIAIVAKGDKGQRFKLSIRTHDIANTRAWYQAVFQTTDKYKTIQIPWSSFVPVRRARYAADLPSMDVSSITEVSFVLSKFELNGLRNLSAEAGEFRLDIMGGI